MFCIRDVAEETRKSLELVWLERVEDAIAAALEPAAPQLQRVG